MARRIDRVGWAMDQPDLSSPQKFVLVILALAAAEVDGACWLAHSTIAERTSLGESTVRRALDALVDKELVVVNYRYMENGKQTSNRYCLGLYTEPEEGAQSEHPRVPRASRRGAQSEHHVEQVTRTSRNKKNSTASQKSPSRRASRARAEDTAEWSDPAAAVFAKEQEPVEPTENAPAKRSPDSAWGLNGYYRQHVFVAGTGRVGNVNDGAMRRFFAEAKRAGVPADTLRSMVDCFVDDPHLFNRTRTHRWKTFIANAPMLQDRAESAAYITSENDTRTPVDRTSSVKGVPKHILDEILAEAG